jgi:hypothetical protein
VRFKSSQLMVLKLTVAALTVSLAFAFAASIAVAAEISSEPASDDPTLQLITIVGDIEPEDVSKFRRIALTHERGLVALESDGGNTLAAIEIGRIIRLKNYDTFVMNDAGCNSACALIWLAGQRRYLSESARVGFHATYTESAGRKTESGVGNAVVGSYLASLSLSQRAVVFATSAGPDKLNWLSHSNSSAAGIDVVKVADVAKDDDDEDETPEIDTAGWWSIRVDSSLNDGCFAFANYEDVALRIGVDARDPITTYVMVFGEDWKSIEIDRKYDIVMKFSGGKSYRDTFVGAQIGDVKGISLNPAPLQLFDLLGGSPWVSVNYRGQEISKLLLDDSKTAIAKIWTCQRRQNTKDPFAR